MPGRFARPYSTPSSSSAARQDAASGSDPASETEPGPDTESRTRAVASGARMTRDRRIEWAADRPECRVVFHNWWNAPRTWAKVQAIDPVASHGSWMENFPWTRLPGVNVPDTQREMVDLARVRALDPVALRQYLGDGNFGGLYQRSDDEMLALWQIAVDETRALLTGSWGEAA